MARTYLGNTEVSTVVVRQVTEQVSTSGFFGQSQYFETTPDTASWLKSDGTYQSGDVYSGMWDWLQKKRAEQEITLYAFVSSTKYTVYLTSPVPTVGATIYGFKPITAVGKIDSVSGDGFVATVVNPETGQTAVASATYLPNGTTKGIIVANGYTASSDTVPCTIVSKKEIDSENWDYFNDYDFIFDSESKTFRLPILNGSEDRPSSKGIVTVSDVASVQRYAYNKYVSTYGQTTSTNTTIATGLGLSGYNRRIAYPTSGGNFSDTVFVPKGQSFFLLAPNVNIATITIYRCRGNGDLYYYVGDTIKDPETIDANAALTQLANTANKDLSNLTVAGKAEISSSASLSSNYTSLTLEASGTRYTAPADGWVFFQPTVSAPSATANFSLAVRIPGSEAAMLSERRYVSTAGYPTVCLPVAKGQLFAIEWTTNLDITGHVLRFTPNKGAQ